MFTLELQDAAKTIEIETDVSLDLLAERARAFAASRIYMTEELVEHVYGPWTKSGNGGERR